MQNAKSKMQTANQGGVTLVIAVVMLAAVTFISFAISTVIIREIGAAQLILRTEPAISGANSGGEIALYRLLRELGGTTTSGTTPQSGASYEVSPRLYVNPYSFSINDGRELRIGLFDAERSTKKTGNYQSSSVQNLGSGPFRVTIFSWSDTATPICPTQMLVQGSSMSCPLNHPTDDRYIVVIAPTANQAAGEIRATREDGSLGVPADRPEMEVVGRSGNVQRKLEISF